MTMNIAVDYVRLSTSATIVGGSLTVDINNSINLVHCGANRFS